MIIYVWLRCDANNANVDRSSAIGNERHSGSRLERQTLKLDGRNERETDSRSGQYLQKLDMFTCAVVRQRLTKTGHSAAVSGSATAYRLGGVGLGSGTMGKLGRAWVCVWHGVWVVVPHGSKENCHSWCRITDVTLVSGSIVGFTIYDLYFWCIDKACITIII